jgi:UDP:flavonoid glycosyltransferase YjiC (YdhE family)
MVPPLGQVTAQALRSAVDTVLGDARYQENARALGENLRGAGGYTHAAQVIQAFAGQRTVLKQG